MLPCSTKATGNQRMRLVLTYASILGQNGEIIGKIVILHALYRHRSMAHPCVQPQSVYEHREFDSQQFGSQLHRQRYSPKGISIALVEEPWKSWRKH